jgi:heterotetrameric sarcosine oxidase gamma subunit
VDSLDARLPLSDVRLQFADTTLHAVDTGPMWSISPFRDCAAPVGDALGGALPKVQRSVRIGGAEVAWFSQGQFMMFGAPDPAALAGIAALTDQSDAWCRLDLSGALCEQVLARLVSVDLRRPAFKRGHCLRTSLNHMPMHVTRISNAGFRVLTFRSMAQTAAHELEAALRSVAARP